MPTSTSNSPARSWVRISTALYGFDLRMDVAHAKPKPREVFGEFLGHLLGERDDEAALPVRRPLANPGVDVLHLAFGGPDDDLGIHEAGRPDSSVPR